MIEARQRALAERMPPPPPARQFIEPVDPGNAADALVILGIAAPDSDWSGSEPRLLLETWAVQAALGRRGLRSLSETDRAGILRSTRQAGKLRWPRRLVP